MVEVSKEEVLVDPQLPTSAEENEIEIIGGNMTVAADMPHQREACPQFQFRFQNHPENAKHCPNCYCYVCQMKASSCSSWLFHCNANCRHTVWKNVRQTLSCEALKMLNADERERLLMKYHELFEFDPSRYSGNSYRPDSESDYDSEYSDEDYLHSGLRHAYYGHSSYNRRPIIPSRVRHLAESARDEAVRLLLKPFIGQSLSKEEYMTATAILTPVIKFDVEFSHLAVLWVFSPYCTIEALNSIKTQLGTKGSQIASFLDICYKINGGSAINSLDFPLYLINLSADAFSAFVGYVKTKASLQDMFEWLKNKVPYSKLITIILDLIMLDHIQAIQMKIHELKNFDTSLCHSLVAQIENIHVSGIICFTALIMNSTWSIFKVTVGKQAKLVRSFLTRCLEKCGHALEYNTVKTVITSSPDIINLIVPALKDSSIKLNTLIGDITGPENVERRFKVILAFIMIYLFQTNLTPYANESIFTETFETFTNSEKIAYTIAICGIDVLNRIDADLLTSKQRTKFFLQLCEISSCLEYSKMPGIVASEFSRFPSIKDCGTADKPRSVIISNLCCLPQDHSERYDDFHQVICKCITYWTMDEASASLASIFGGYLRINALERFLGRIKNDEQPTLAVLLMIWKSMVILCSEINFVTENPILKKIETVSRCLDFKSFAQGSLVDENSHGLEVFQRKLLIASFVLFTLIGSTNTSSYSLVKPSLKAIKEKYIEQFSPILSESETTDEDKAAMVATLYMLPKRDNLLSLEKIWRQFWRPFAILCFMKAFMGSRYVIMNFLRDPIDFSSLNIASGVWELIDITMEDLDWPTSAIEKNFKKMIAWLEQSGNLSYFSTCIEANEFFKALKSPSCLMMELFQRWKPIDLRSLETVINVFECPHLFSVAAHQALESPYRNAIIAKAENVLNSPNFEISSSNYDEVMSLALYYAMMERWHEFEGYLNDEFLNVVHMQSLLTDMKTRDEILMDGLRPIIICCPDKNLETLLLILEKLLKPKITKGNGSDILKIINYRIEMLVKKDPTQRSSFFNRFLFYCQYNKETCCAILSSSSTRKSDVAWLISYVADVKLNSDTTDDAIVHRTALIEIAIHGFPQFLLNEPHKEPFYNGNNATLMLLQALLESANAAILFKIVYLEYLLQILVYMKEFTASARDAILKHFPREWLKDLTHASSHLPTMEPKLPSGATLGWLKTLKLFEIFLRFYSKTSYDREYIAQGFRSLLSPLFAEKFYDNIIRLFIDSSDLTKTMHFLFDTHSFDAVLVHVTSKCLAKGTFQKCADAFLTQLDREKPSRSLNYLHGRRDDVNLMVNSAGLTLLEQNMLHMFHLEGLEQTLLFASLQLKLRYRYPLINDSKMMLTKAAVANIGSMNTLLGELKKKLSPYEAKWLANLVDFHTKNKPNNIVEIFNQHEIVMGSIGASHPKVLRLLVQLK